MKTAFKALLDKQAAQGSVFTQTLPEVFGGPSPLVNQYTLQAGETRFVYQHIYDGVYGGNKVSFRSNLVYRAKTQAEVPVAAFNN